MNENSVATMLELNWPTKSAKSFREAATGDRVCWRIEKLGPQCKDLCHSVVIDGDRKAKLSHIDVNKTTREITLNFHGPVRVSSVSNGKDTLVELRAAGSGQHTSRDDWSASMAMDTCCCDTSFNPVAFLWASPTARSPLQSCFETANSCPRTIRSLSRLPRSSRHPSPWTQDHLKLHMNESLDYSTRRNLDCLQETVHAVGHSSIRKSNGVHHANLIIRWPLETDTPWSWQRAYWPADTLLNATTSEISC